jgi:hypothetical protein
MYGDVLAVAFSSRTLKLDEKPTVLAYRSSDGPCPVDVACKVPVGSHHLVLLYNLALLEPLDQLARRLRRRSSEAAA